MFCVSCLAHCFGKWSNATLPIIGPPKKGTLTCLCACVCASFPALFLSCELAFLPLIDLLPLHSCFIFEFFSLRSVDRITAKSRRRLCCFRVGNCVHALQVFFLLASFACLFLRSATEGSGCSGYGSSKSSHAALARMLVFSIGGHFVVSLCFFGRGFCALAFRFLSITSNTPQHHRLFLGGGGFVPFGFLVSWLLGSQILVVLASWFFCFSAS